MAPLSLVLYILPKGRKTLCSLTAQGPQCHTDYKARLLQQSESQSKKRLLLVHISLFPASKRQSEPSREDGRANLSPSYLPANNSPMYLTTHSPIHTPPCVPTAHPSSWLRSSTFSHGSTELSVHSTACLYGQTICMPPSTLATHLSCKDPVLFEDSSLSEACLHARVFYKSRS